MKNITKALLIALIVIFSALVIWGSIFYLIRNNPWPTWTGFEEKTLWDIIEIVIIPVFLALIVIWFNYQSNRNSNRISNNQTQDSTLEKYLDYLSNILIIEEFLNAEKNRQLLRAKTLTALHRLNGERKGVLIRYLYNLDLININDQVIDLSGSDLNNIDLSGSDHSGNKDRTLLSYLSLFEASFIGAEMRKADFSEAKLSRSKFMFSDLTNSNFKDAHLMDADFTCATLKNVNFQNASLLGADLSNTTGLTKRQLRKAKTLKATILPDYLGFNNVD